MSKRKICIITATRAEYSASKWLMREILNDPDLELQVIVTGTHLEEQFGNTIQEIERDNIPIDYRIKIHCTNDSPQCVANSIGECAIGMSKALADLNPDILVVLGDRYELLPVCSVAVVMGIPIAHVSGGDITEGAIDDSIRHAITKLSHIHFPGTEYSAKVLRQLGESDERIFVVGEPGLDNFTRLKSLSKRELALSLKMDENKKWVMFTYHPETLSRGDDLSILESVFSALDALDFIQVMMTYPNADPGSLKIIDFIENIHAKNPSKYRLKKNLGQLAFTSFLKVAWCMLGNSSSSLFEAPTAKLPAILINDRQKGRILSGNIIPATGDINSLKKALKYVDDDVFQSSLRDLINPYGDGYTAVKIISILKQVDLTPLLYKRFIQQDF
ncbi:MAG: UDP-N-acetylglucosamine 2-epimerase (hydrolyzing) [Pseudodesulfovibrio sp.]|nr:UDP-N-acetylglucosamine 2-epimerase (hydrolyzing) [Pseudodesulfovibrio sp.]